MLRVGLVGVGKMGISHLAILGAHPEVEIGGICTRHVLHVGIRSSTVTPGGKQIYDLARSYRQTDGPDSQSPYRHDRMANAQK